MKKVLTFLSLTVILLLSACSGRVIPATARPETVEPAIVPTTVPAAEKPSAGSPGSAAELTGTTWQWIGFTGPNEQIEVESPASYSLVFHTDGTLDITVDCNNAQGSYQLDGQSIRIQVGAMTKAMCAPGSRSNEFIRDLASAAIYFTQDGNLYIDLMADAGTLVFAPAETGSAQGGKGAVMDAFLANPWQWVSFTSPVEQYDVTPSQNYLITFNADGILDIKADCNNSSGTYLLDGNKITITPGPTTMAACPPGSRSDEFLKYLGSAAIYFYQPGELYFDLFADGGTMKFIPFIQ